MTTSSVNSASSRSSSREYPNLDVLPVREARDENARVEAASRSLLRDHPDLVAIYNAGGGQAGAIAALEATGQALLMSFLLRTN